MDRKINEEILTHRVQGSPWEPIFKRANMSDMSDEDFEVFESRWIRLIEEDKKPEGELSDLMREASAQRDRYLAIDPIMG